MMEMWIRIHFLLWSLINLSDNWKSQICGIYLLVSTHLSIQIIIKQLKPLNHSRQPVMTDAIQRSLKLYPMLFTTYSPSESLGRVYSPPQNNSKERKRLCPRYCSSVHLQCYLRGPGWGGNSAEIVPLMKTNWRNQGSFLLPSQEANPNNMKLPKPRFSFAQRGLKSMERTICKIQERINTIQHKEKGE